MTGASLPGEGSAVVYGMVGDEWTEFFLPVLRAMGTKAVAAATGVTERSVREWLAGRRSPHDGNTHHLAKAKEVAVAFARQGAAPRLPDGLPSVEYLRPYSARSHGPRG